jgi:hypothetical protein
LNKKEYHKQYYLKNRERLLQYQKGYNSYKKSQKELQKILLAEINKYKLTLEYYGYTVTKKECLPETSCDNGRLGLHSKGRKNRKRTVPFCEPRSSDFSDTSATSKAWSDDYPYDRGAITGIQ